jgi:hypothetical protein
MVIFRLSAFIAVNLGTVMGCMSTAIVIGPRIAGSL